MDVNFELGDYKFVWDSEKAEKNWQKHRVRFENAIRVFLMITALMILMKFTAILRTDIKLSAELMKFWL